MSNEGTNIRVVISTESNKKLEGIQAALLSAGKGHGKREAIEWAVSIAHDALGLGAKAKPRKRG